MKLTFLGTGTSSGVPMIACSCDVCHSTDPKDKRLRSSVLIEHPKATFTIDIGPDFRQQMLKEQVTRLDGIIVTHSHRDHTAGLDDVRAYNFALRQDMHLYATKYSQQEIINQFQYIFEPNPYPGIARVAFHTIDTDPFDFHGITIRPIEVMHHKMPVLGFRIEDLTYITDAKTISEKEKEKIKGTRVLIINALRKREHMSHMTLEEALALIEEVKPERSYLTHISHQMGLHNEVQRELPENVVLAYDGLVVEQ